MYLWLWVTLASGVLLGLYDIFKKKALERNALFTVLALYSLFSFILVSFEINNALKLDWNNITIVFLKSSVIFVSWILGFIAIKNMPISIITPFGTLSPLFTIVLGILVLNEKLGALQTIGIAIILCSYYLIGKAGNSEVKGLFKNKYLYLMIISALLSATSALIDKIALKHINVGQLQFWFSLFLTLMYSTALLIIKIKEKLKASTEDKNNQTVENCILEEKSSVGKSIINSNYLERLFKKGPIFILLMSFFLVSSDRIYFMAVKIPASQISIIMPLRKISVFVSAIIGGIIFKEKNLKVKFMCISLLIVGIILAFIGK